MVLGNFLIAAAALKTPTRNGYNAQGVKLTFGISRTGETRHSDRLPQRRLRVKVNTSMGRLFFV